MQIKRLSAAVAAHSRGQSDEVNVSPEFLESVAGAAVKNSSA